MIPGDFQIKKPSGKRVALFSALGLGGLAALTAAFLLFMWVMFAWFTIPPAIGEGPEQPIDFPHTTHVEELGLDCVFCHREVETSAQASIPAVSLCMTCHQAVDGSDDDAMAEIRKIRNAYEEGDPVDWVRVHRVPDHVHFVHEAHIKYFMEQGFFMREGVPETAVCSTCHGDVGAMETVQQVESLKMADCVECHRENDAPTDCTTCHY